MYTLNDKWTVFVRFSLFPPSVVFDTKEDAEDYYKNTLFETEREVYEVMPFMEAMEKCIKNDTKRNLHKYIKRFI